VGKAEGGPGPTGPGRAHNLIVSFGYALRGLGQVWLSERNLRIHVVAALGVLALAHLLAIGGLELALLTLAVAAVLGAELANTALEALVNLVTRRYHPLAAVIKNTAAGMVLVAASGALVVGAVVFGPDLAGLPGRLAQAARARPVLAVAYAAGLVVLTATGLAVPRRRFF